jgi:deoxyribodipyrimidine photo-lyase
MNSELFDSDPFEPTPAAAQARLAAVLPAEYARTRNHLDGAVTRLSPYITCSTATWPATT